LVQISGCQDRDVLMARNVNEFFVTKDNLRRWRDLVATEGTVRAYQGPARRFDGSTIWVRNSVRAVRDADGQIIYYEGAIEDITASHNVEAESLREKALSEKTLDSMPGVFYLFDEGGRYLRWNHNLERVSGYDATEIAQMHPLDMIESTDCKIVAQKMSEAFSTGAASVEAHLRAKDGTSTLY